MKLRIINPNTTAAMTEAIGAAARLVAAPGTEIRAVNPASGPASIEGFYDAAFAVPGLLAEIAAGEALSVDALIIACFDDTGLDAARCAARAPVIGIGEAAFHLATLVASRFSVVTTLSRSIAGIEANLARYGLGALCGGVRATEIPVLAIDTPEARERISVEIGRAKLADRAEAIVLGCAGMAGLAKELAAEHDLPVIEGVAAAVKLAEALVGLGLRTSHHGAYARPAAKPYGGMFAPFAPG